MEPTIAPVKNAKYKAVIILGNPQNYTYQKCQFYISKAHAFTFCDYIQSQEKRKAPTQKIYY